MRLFSDPALFNYVIMVNVCHQRDSLGVGKGTQADQTRCLCWDHS